MWKITFFFSQFNVTWTEVYYTTVSTVALAFGEAQLIATARVALNGPQTVLSAIRVVNLAAPRLSNFVTPGTFAANGTYVFAPASDPDQDSAPAFEAVQVKFVGQAGNICRRYLAGAPQGIIGTRLGGKNLMQLGLWFNALTGFVQALSSSAWSFRYSNQAANQLVQQVLTSAQFPGEIGVQFGQQMIAPVPGKPIQMRFKGFRKVNYRQFGIGGVYTVDPASPGITAAVAPFIYYLQNTSQVQVANIAVKGVGCQLLYGYDLFSPPTSSGPQTAFAVLSANHRKRGASALALRGRSRSKP